MSPLITTLVTTLVVLLTASLLLWLVSLWRRDASIIDPCWGLGFVLVSWIACALHAPASARSLMLAMLTTVWGLRLSLHLIFRRRGHGEDRRYAAMRAAHGPRFWWISLLTVFLLQAVILWFVSLPLQAVAVTSGGVIGWLDLIGVGVWSIGLFFESVGDWQLARFVSDPSNRGRVLDTGLWRYTRHPNYFGDCCVWWGVYVIAAAGGAWWTILSPLVMTALLLKVSGVALLESTIRQRRPGYAEYCQRTNAFFPGPVRAPQFDSNGR